jgi:hypothetical protein
MAHFDLGRLLKLLQADNLELNDHQVKLVPECQ